jgi:protein-S-isoprenylcysteine O-methyltransferase Ste14
VQRLSAELFVRWFLAVYFSSVAGYYTIAILRMKRRLGVSPVSKGPRGSLHRRLHQTFVVFRALIWLACVSRVAWPGIDRWLVPVAPLWQPPVMLAGVALLVLAFAAILGVHAAIGSGWRSRTEDSGAGRVMTTGPYGRVRNPVFIGIQAAQLGLFLALPTVFTLICLIVGIACVQMETRLEEAHLQARFGGDYAAYAARTGRWWPHW